MPSSRPRMKAFCVEDSIPVPPNPTNENAGNSLLSKTNSKSDVKTPAPEIRTVVPTSFPTLFSGCSQFVPFLPRCGTIDRAALNR